MTFLALVALVAAIVLIYRRVRGGSAHAADLRETTERLDAWLESALENELADAVLGLRGSTPEERKKLARTLADEPDAEVVGKIEELVRSVELEFVRYEHEADFEAIVRVRYEDGKTGTATRRFAAADIPEAVRVEFQQKRPTRVFRGWSFPWQRARAL